MTKKLYIIILFLLISLFAFGQQVGMYSHAFFKPMIYNPAFTGNEDNTNAMLLSKAQWTGFKNAPQLNIFTLDGSLLAKKAGIGLILLSERKGITNRIGGYLNYSYRLKISDDANLRFGVAAGVIDQTIDYSKVLVEDVSDPFLFGDSQRKTFIDANAGLAFFWKGLELGVSVPQLLGNKVQYVDNISTRSKYSLVRHILGSLKYKIALSEEKGIYVSPQALVRYVSGTPFQYDATVNLEWQDKFWIGATYKSDYAVAAHAGICLHKQLYVGYAYDIILGDLSKYSGMSHELMINFKFGKNKKEEEPEQTKNNAATTDALSKRLDSLQAVVTEDQNKINEDRSKIKELNDKIQQQAKTIEAQAQKQAEMVNSAPVQNNNVPAENNTNTNTTTPTSNNNNNNTNTNSNTPTSGQKNENLNVAAVEKNTNKEMNNGIWYVMNSVKDFKDANNRTPQKGFYVIAGTFTYRDFAEAEIPRLKSKGYPNSNRIFSESKQYNYVFIYRSATKAEAGKKAEAAKSAGIKDAWVLELNE
ncbi:MAG: putative rane protein [Bacteroidetes bacterium]|nr:putative rane protein [Bacteroidota bacterium]